MGVGRPSHLKAVVRLALRGLLARGGGEPGVAQVPRRRVAAERRGIVVTRRHLDRYLAVTGGQGIDGFWGADAVLPPAYPATWETALLLELLLAEDVPFPRGGMIHLGGETICVRPLRVDDRVRCRVEIDRLDADPRGLRLALVTRNWNARDQLCAEGRMLLLLRRPDAARGGAPAREAEAVEPRWEEVARWRVAANHGRRYARVSGDFNPIHLWPLTARLLGFRRPILHGYCTEAMVAHALIAHRLGGDPTALRRLEIRFRAPLPLPSTVRLLASPSRFRLLDGPTDRVFAEGSFVGEGQGA